MYIQKRKYFKIIESSFSPMSSRIGQVNFLVLLEESYIKVKYENEWKHQVAFLK